MDRTMRQAVPWFAVMALVLSLGFAGCGGGDSSTGPAPNAVSITLSGAYPDPAGLLSAAPQAVGAMRRMPVTADNVDHAWITVTRVALLPAEGSGPNPDGEDVVEAAGGPDTEGRWADVEPEEIDLLALSRGVEGVRFVEALRNVPAGTYGKIRLWYRNPKVHFVGDADNVSVHGTGHFRLDIHFTGDRLVIPAEAGDALRLYEVGVTFVVGREGLKINVNNNKVLMRPQVFASVAVVRFAAAGIADNVERAGGTFDIATDNGTVAARFDASPLFFFRDDFRWVAADNVLGRAALADGAIVEAYGSVSAGVLVVDQLLITFPVVRTGAVASGSATNGWNPDNTFTLGLASDNVVFPMPDRAGAFYDNGAFPYAPLTEGAVRQGVAVTARGYAAAGGVAAWWITAGP